MKAILKLVCGIFLILLMLTISQAHEWRGIAPLRSTRSDVERQLGTIDEKSPVLYRLKDVNVLIAYADGLRCGENGADGWNVDRDTVLTIAIHFKSQEPKLSELKLDLSKFEKVTDPEIPDTFYYRNDEEGINIQASNKRAGSMAYYPAKKYWHLMCPKPAPNNSFNRTRS